MSDLHIENISFKSSNGVDTVAGYCYTMPGVKLCAIVQISHGMCEYVHRYKELAEVLAKQGYVVCGNDHLGHGQTSGENGLDGYFGEQDGRYFVLRDLKQMNDLIRQKYPGLPLVLLGHSMGSFFARWFASQYPQALDALMLSGTAGPNPLAGVGIRLTEWLAHHKGGTYVSPYVNKLAFGAYLKKVNSPKTPYDWISRDMGLVAKYAADKKCTFVFTVSAFHELFCVLRQVSSLQWAQGINKDLPIWLFAGDMDPVGDYGKGVKKVAQLLKQAEIKAVTLTLYPGGRHEMLNETNRQQVYQDMLRWLAQHVKK